MHLEVDRALNRLSELDIRPQFNLARSAIRRSSIGVYGPAAIDPKCGALNGVPAKIHTSIRRTWPEGRVIKGVQHLGLQAEMNRLGDWDVLRD